MRGLHFNTVHWHSIRCNEAILVDFISKNIIYKSLNVNYKRENLVTEPNIPGFGLGAAVCLPLT